MRVLFAGTPEFARVALQSLLDAGFKVTAVDVSELQKAEGAVTCCSLLLRTGTTA